MFNFKFVRGITEPIILAVKCKDYDEALKYVAIDTKIEVFVQKVENENRVYESLKVDKWEHFKTIYPDIRSGG